MLHKIERRAVTLRAQTSPLRQWTRAALAVLRKDLRAELRTRYALNALAVFALTVVLVVSFYLGPRLAPRDPLTPAVNSALLWIALFFAALTGLGRAFVHEEEAQTTTLLRLNAPPLAVFAGKWLLNLILLLFLAAAITVLLYFMLNMRVRNLTLLGLTVLLGATGLASAVTLIAAIVAKAAARSALFAVLAFPVVFPLLVIAMTSTEQALIGEPWQSALPQIQGLAAYVVAVTAAALFLFPFVWDA